MSGPAARGRLAILAAAVLWGSIGVVSTGLFRLGLSPWEVAFWRAALSAGALLAWLGAARREALRPGTPRDALLLAGYGVVAVGLFYVSFQLATWLTSVAVAVVLLYTAPVFVLLGARLFLGEALTPAKGIMAALVVAGVWATALGARGAEVRLDAAGVAWGIAAALAYSSYYLFGRRYLPRYGVPRTLFWSLASGTVVLAAAGAAVGEPPRLPLPGAAWPLLLALSLGTTLLANALYYWGIARTEAGVAAVIAAIEPVVAALLALAVFGERLAAAGWVGVGLVVCGVAAGGWRGRARRLHPAPATDTAPPHSTESS